MYTKQSKNFVCQMADNFWHIGVEGGPCYVLETSEGSVLIDTAFPDSLDTLLENLRAIRKEITDVKHIIHTHGHIDHVGCTKRLAELCGAKTYVGREDADAVMGKNKLVYAEELGIQFTDTFVPDVMVDDGDTLISGDTEIRFVSTPGHTMGTVSLFFDVYVEGKKYHAGMFGGAGLNTLTSEYLRKYDLPVSMRTQFIESIDRILDIPVDFHVGNHLSDNDFRGKAPRIREGFNPFLAENTYKSFLKKRKKQAREAFACGK